MRRLSHFPKHLSVLHKLGHVFECHRSGETFPAAIQFVVEFRDLSHRHRKGHRPAVYNRFLLLVAGI